MASNFFGRYTWLINTVLQCGPISIRELSDKWRLSSLNPDGSPLPERTFFNHKREILEQFGIEIRYQKGLGYYISNKDDLGSDGLRNWLLTSIAANSTVQESAGMSARILIEPIPEGLQYLNVIIDAMKENHTIEIAYKRFEETETRTLEIEPYCLKLFHQRWYVLGKSDGYDKPRPYSLDRISQLKVRSRKFRLPRNFNAKEFFSEYFGVVIDDTPVSRVRLKVWDPHRMYMRALPLQESQVEIETTAEWSIFQYRMAPTWDLSMELMKYHDMVEVLEPESLRDDVIDHAYCILDMYGER
jgi:predicted DNA-binding transcriptional regulator YafY